MHIAVDVRSLMEGRHSGVEEYTTEIIRGMLRVGPQHVYHLFYNAARPVALPSFEGPVLVHAFRFPNKLFNLAQFTSSWPRWDRLVEADCFFAPHFRLMPLSPDAPLITTVHDLSFEHFPEFFSWRRRVWHHLMRPRVLLRNSDQIIAVSEATKADVTALYGISAERVAVVHSGVKGGWSTTPEDIAEVRRRLALPKRFVLYLGTLEPRKNVDSIIRAFDSIADRVPNDLVIAGAPGWLTGTIDRAARNARHTSRIHFTGFIAEQDKAALLAAAELFVYPSLYEGFGFPPLEALLSGTPVITSFNSALPEVVGDWAVLVDPYDVAELALVMREVLDDPPHLTGDERIAIAHRYTWDRSARETLAAIERAV